ncbi:MAG TPA: trypsin-like peptidase domain-containing protein [Acidimicrobiales bacterium]|nr:trypsin-like peptidase domain-containing protein [Acidimicrobiales bacterium]
MKRAACVVSGVVLMTTLTNALTAACGDQDPPDPAGSVVAIRASGCRLLPNRAVGLVVADGLVATVAHAVAGEEEITVSTPDGRTLAGAVAAIDTALDAAILRVDGLDLPALRRRPYSASEPVALVTADEDTVSSQPVGVRRAVTIRTSDIYREGEHLRPGFELEAPVAAGDSGGGLVAQDGSLLAVVWATSREREGRAWALAVEAYGPLVDAARAGDPPARVDCAR